ncbi:hypothetical protein U1839_06015 [Sphingomonas sp. RT2P30]|uniref:hypothetical protein n=1 Tax=Parasphingomonas halimpatiens TaxID=3096162 RepID=UPI002FCC7E77
MTSNREQLIAYLATLAALVIVFTIAIVAGGISPGVAGHIEVYGLGTVTGGLIGLLRLPSVRNPVGITDSGDVNVTAAVPAPDAAPDAPADAVAPAPHAPATATPVPVAAPPGQ